MDNCFFGTENTEKRGRTALRIKGEIASEPVGVESLLPRFDRAYPQPSLLLSLNCPLWHFGNIGCSQGSASTGKPKELSSPIAHKIIHKISMRGPLQRSVRCWTQTDGDKSHHGFYSSLLVKEKSWHATLFVPTSPVVLRRVTPSSPHIVFP